ncbi:asparagine synthase [Leucobacter triazinivorans]|uniref:Asparagine synthase n=1 Tax=Leucobacter triazinivorans TaxID=1784719 RepID=A0A4P6KBV9_9MICO|nr:asparagine synthase [Leucobacter triazinivorans]QBE47786.1 asparagine synthase [Leucobacter triazinivorans]
MFGWSKKRKRGSSRPQRRLPRRVLAPVEEIVEQGLLVADVAVRMTVKNAIIMNALKRHVDYRESQIIDMVREATEDLARERERDATHISRMRNEIRDTGRSSWSESDYGNDDNRTLRHRQEVYERVAEELHARAADDAYLAETAERARNLAWHEIGDSLKERASHPYYSGGDSDEYRSERDGRIQQLIEKDLTALIQQQSGAAKPRRSRRKDRESA